MILAGLVIIIVLMVPGVARLRPMLPVPWRAPQRRAAGAPGAGAVTS